MTDARSVVWVDAGGAIGITRITSSAGAAATQAAIVAASHTDYVNYWEGTIVPNPTPTPTPGDYSGVQSRANLIFACADGTAYTVQILAPLRSIFMADGTTVDPTNPLVVSLVTAAIAELTNPAGSPVTALVIGTLGPL